MTTLEHPAWCNRKHLPGANPNHQVHENVWRSVDKTLPIKVQTYPCAGGYQLNDGSMQEAGSFVWITCKFGEVRVWLSSEEIRSLADRLNLIADLATSMSPEMPA